MVRRNQIAEFHKLTLVLFNRRGVRLVESRSLRTIAALLPRHLAMVACLAPRVFRQVRQVMVIEKEILLGDPEPVRCSYGVGAEFVISFLIITRAGSVLLRHLVHDVEPHKAGLHRGIVGAGSG